jgi:hypothetical protein
MTAMSCTRRVSHVQVASHEDGTLDGSAPSAVDGQQALEGGGLVLGLARELGFPLSRALSGLLRRSGKDQAAVMAAPRTSLAIDYFCERGSTGDVARGQEPDN